MYMVVLSVRFLLRFHLWTNSGDKLNTKSSLDLRKSHQRKHEEKTWKNNEYQWQIQDDQTANTPNVLIAGMVGWCLQLGPFQTSPTAGWLESSEYVPRIISLTIIYYYTPSSSSQLNNSPLNKIKFQDPIDPASVTSPKLLQQWPLSSRTQLARSVGASNPWPKTAYSKRG